MQPPHGGGAVHARGKRGCGQTEKEGCTLACMVAVLPGGTKPSTVKGASGVLNCWGFALSPPLPLPCPLSLDTGRLNPETYRVFDAVEKHYGIHIEYTFPDAKETMDLVRTKGLFSFYTDGHNECCKVRKVRCDATHGARGLHKDE
jgi:hypothetical protein